MYEIKITNYVYSKFKLTNQNIYFHIFNTFPDNMKSLIFQVNILILFPSISTFYSQKETSESIL